MAAMARLMPLRGLMGLGLGLGTAALTGTRATLPSCRRLAHVH